MTTPEVTLDDADAFDRVRVSLIRSLQDRRQLIEHREEIEALLERASETDGVTAALAIDDALGLALNAHRRDTERNSDSDSDSDDAHQ